MKIPNGLVSQALWVCFVLTLGATPVLAERIKDLASLAGVRSNQLVGYGLVVGLSGSGDGNLGVTLQSLESMLSRFGLSVDPASLNGDNVAAVMVTSELPPFVKPGQTIDVVVSAMGAAESLRGGTLLMTPLLGADGETYAVAQGNLAVGGLGITAEDGSSLTVNVPTVGRVPQGATVERMVDSPFLTNDYMVLNLHMGDFTMSDNVARAINKLLGKDVAVAMDGTSIRVRAPSDPAQKVSFASLIQDIEVDPGRPAAKVVVNSRTGTIVIGGSVRVSSAAVAHGSLTLRVTERQTVDTSGGAGGDAGMMFDDAGNIISVAPDPVLVPESTIDVSEQPARAFMFTRDIALDEIVQAINEIGATPSDLVAILEALKVAGALRAELIVI